MKYYELKKDEAQLLKEFERGDWARVKALPSQRRKYEQYANATLSKAKNINIRVSEKDLQKIKSQAAEKGIPYQTLLASLIHQYSSGRVQDQLP